jgi:DNA ligase-1
MLAKHLLQYVDKLEYPVAVQPKLDGVRAILTDEGFTSRNNKPIEGMPNLEKNVSQYKDISPDGELFCRYKGFQSIVSSVRRSTNIREDIDIGYWIFDCNIDAPFVERHELLSKTVAINNRVKLLNYHIVDNIEQLYHWYNYFINEGFEGIIVRDLNSKYETKRTKALLKMKPTKSMEVVIVKLIEGNGKYNNSLGAIECLTLDNKTVFVGSGFSDAKRDLLWKMQDTLIDRRITIKYQELTDEGVPRFPVYVGVRDYE